MKDQDKIITEKNESKAPREYYPGNRWSLMRQDIIIIKINKKNYKLKREKKMMREKIR